MKGLDYSTRANPAAVKAAGYGFCVRYASVPIPGGKGITVAEAQAIHAAGLGLVLVYEWYAARAKEGKVAGRADAKVALAVAQSLNFPADRPIYFAVDYNAPVWDQPAIDAYLNGAAEVLGAERIGVYGSYSVVERCAANHTAQWFWQTYAWSAGKVAPHAHFRQYRNGVTVAGASVDLNETYKPDFGAWFPIAKPKAVKQPIHIMTPAEMLAWMKNLTKK